MKVKASMAKSTYSAYTLNIRLHLRILYWLNRICRMPFIYSTKTWRSGHIAQRTYRINAHLIYVNFEDNHFYCVMVSRCFPFKSTIHVTCACTELPVDRWNKVRCCMCVCSYVDCGLSLASVRRLSSHTEWSAILLKLLTLNKDNRQWAMKALSLGTYTVAIPEDIIRLTICTFCYCADWSSVYKINPEILFEWNG